MTRTLTLQVPVQPYAAAEAVSVKEIFEQRVSPGVLVLAPPMRLLHMNQRASQLLWPLSERDNAKGQSKRAKGLLPPFLHQVCADIFRQLQEGTHPKDWERLEVKRLISASDRPLLLRGFGVPDRSGRQNLRIVLLIEEIGGRSEEISEETALRFQLTEREQAVVQCLSNGWTNKEIATALTLALPTVKEHIRHIMTKTRTTTRTGILIQVFRI